MPVKEIAEILNEKEETVKEWLSEKVFWKRTGNFKSADVIAEVNHVSGFFGKIYRNCILKTE